MTEHVVRHIGERGDDIDVQRDLWLGHACRSLMLRDGRD